MPNTHPSCSQTTRNPLFSPGLWRRPKAPPPPPGCTSKPKARPVSTARPELGSASGSLAQPLLA
eukprot:15349444-Alexandrium_andersonii.AAC.1